MGFREREKRRIVPLKEGLFSAEACESGLYGESRYDFVFAMIEHRKTCTPVFEIGPSTISGKEASLGTIRSMACPAIICAAPRVSA